MTVAFRRAYKSVAVACKLISFSERGMHGIRVTNVLELGHANYVCFLRFDGIRLNEKKSKGLLVLHSSAARL